MIFKAKNGGSGVTPKRRRHDPGRYRYSGVLVSRQIVVTCAGLYRVDPDVVCCAA